jgi:WD40 repeat protein
MEFSPDGKTLASLDTDRTLRLWDAETGKPRSLGADLRLKGALRFAFRSDRRTLITINLEGVVRTWALDDGREMGSFSTGGSTRHRLWCAHVTNLGDIPGEEAVVFAPDSRMVAIETNDGAVNLWDVTSGKRLARLDTPRSKAWDALLRFSPDSRHLAIARVDSFTIWQVPSGKKIAELTRDLPYAFSPDGRLLARPVGDKVCLLDLGKGKEIRELDGHEGGVELLAFEEGGRLLVTGSSRDRAVRVWDVATGHELGRMTGDERWPFHAMRLRTTSSGRVLAEIALDGKNSHWTIREPITGRTVGALGFGEHFDVSPDGRMLATWGYLRHEAVLVDTATGEELGRLTGHRGEVAAVAFSPDGRRVATGGADTSILVWDWRDACGLTPEVRGRVGRRELQAWWADLASDNAGRAERAAAALAAAGKEGVAFLRTRVRPVTAKERGAWRRLLADLDSDEFEVRERASAALAASGAEAVPFLRRTLAGDLSPEARRRLDEVMQDARLTRWSDAALRRLRAVAALEWNDAPETARLLEALARGEASERLTQEAKAALRRRAAR